MERGVVNCAGAAVGAAVVDAGRGKVMTSPVGLPICFSKPTSLLSVNSLSPTSTVLVAFKFNSSEMSRTSTQSLQKGL